MERAPEALPPWGSDPLAEDYLSKAERNVRITALNWRDVYEVQQKAHALLKQVGEALEHDLSDKNLLAPRMLILRGHSAVFAAMRLAMSGQAVEARSVLRQAIEGAWYALHIAKDPAPPARADIWWNRHTSPQAKDACKREFLVGTVRATHQALDTGTADVMQQVYEDLIDFGAHPNERGVASSLRLDKSEPDAVKVGIAVLQPGSLAAGSALKAAVDVTIGIVKVVGLIYPERFQIMGLDAGIAELNKQSKDVFGKLRDALQQGSTG